MDFTKYVANGFADFRGTTISGKVPMKEEFVNRLIADLLTPPQSVGVASKPGAIDPKLFLTFLKSATVKADAGVMTVEFKVAI